MLFTGAVDAGSGVDGFSFAWTRRAASAPDFVKDREQAALSATSPRLRNGAWYFHLRTRDNAGNWSDAVHRGPYLVDRKRPRVTALASSGRVGRTARLKYRISENTRKTRERIDIYRSGNRVKTIRTRMLRSDPGVTYSVGWTARSAGAYRFCVRAWDRARNRSALSCASLTIRAVSPPPPSSNCSDAYPTVCIPPPPPDLDCAEVAYSNFAVRPPDPHGFDGDGDGIGCET